MIEVICFALVLSLVVVELDWAIGLLIALVIISVTAPAYAGVRSCAKRTVEITKDPKTGITIKSMSGDTITFAIKGKAATSAQLDLFEELEDCMAAAGQDQFLVYHEEDKRTRSCHYFPLQRQWGCREVLMGGGK